jgi:hypothetical protein
MATKKQANKTWQELETLLESLQGDIFPGIRKTKEEIDKYKELLLDGTEDNISIKGKILELEEAFQKQVDFARESVQEVLEFHEKVFKDGEEDAIKTQLENFLTESENIFKEAGDKKEAFDSFYEKVFGIENTEGEREGGLEKELEKHTAQSKKLLERIEDLLPGATSVGLANVFSDKVKEYSKSVNLWTWISFGLLLLLGIYYVFFPIKASNMSDVFLHLFQRLPFIVFAIWLVVFAGNRRAESKKLEESYKHKEVMARSFVGYKEHIEELEESDTDKTLLKEHMGNLLTAINENSGDFLGKFGDKSPIHDVMDLGKSVLQKNKNTPSND